MVAVWEEARAAVNKETMSFSDPGRSPAVVVGPFSALYHIVYSTRDVGPDIIVLFFILSSLLVDGIVGLRKAFLACLRIVAL